MENALELYNDIQPSDLPESFQEVARVIGIDGCIKLAQEFAGTNIYFPKFDKLIRISRNRKIKKDYLSGASCRQLARKYNVSEVWVRQIVNEQ